ncbi:hypothetical protein [Arthrobacter sp. Marseille-P9274]|uniref:hypothetical protein n=1 Tax=Arthrobacter sp. Marseille-P9274 TaxID=2866572 RepID=UPI0021C82E54|nr:hypothetical protein [Arthrobacter sp. Marseille-P9274]
MPYLIALGVVAVLLSLMVEYWYVVLPIALLLAVCLILPGVIRHIRKERYFASEEFQRKKAEIASFVAEHNAIAEYTSEIRNQGSFQLGVSSTGAHSHLAKFENTSHHNYRRDRHEADYKASNVHNCSLQVVRSAKADPLKYLMKYFNIKADETHLTEVEGLGEDIARLENAIDNLRQREASITTSIEPPAFILQHYKNEFMEHVGVELSPIRVRTLSMPSSTSVLVGTARSGQPSS